MAERSVHEAAVEAVAGALETTNVSTNVGSYTVGWHTLARAAVAALVASAEVREARVRCLRRGDTNLPCDWTAVHPDCFLAALGGGES